MGSKRPRERVIEVRGAHLPADALLYAPALCWALFALGGFERDVVVLLLCARARGTGFTWWRLTLR
ncbi:hypothetical protein ACFRAR_11390 [Kitasatospora sp. NPDC056651]|uniref:hypothetical protein n=1 Tax=Kitasatospora sp. NPDC056651 TaxID=3345892 RepID=UPI0036D01A69